MPQAIATNHQSGPEPAARPGFTRSYERHAHLKDLRVSPRHLNRHFLKPPLIQNRYAEGFGTLFTAEYNPIERTLGLTLSGERWDQALDAFEEGQRHVDYSGPAGQVISEPSYAAHEGAGIDWSRAAGINWAAVGQDYAGGRGRPIHTYLAAKSDTGREAS